ncbi:MAG: hypothetical protein CM15mP29_0920 [Alphaproteobacteria bacterium]|nr:MAG: hypothetical protein CM15mP29_0920 [Alphaproteobacteria bacterium]
MMAMVLGIQILMTIMMIFMFLQSQVRRFNLRQGDKVAGQVRQPKDKEKYYGLTKVEMVNGFDPESNQMKQRPVFENLLQFILTKG